MFILFEKRFFPKYSILNRLNIKVQTILLRFIDFILTDGNSETKMEIILSNSDVTFSVLVLVQIGDADEF